MALVASEMPCHNVARMIGDYLYAVLALGALWIACVLIPRPVRKALVNGLRCMRRYPDLWRLPLAFGLAHGAFQLAGQVLFQWRVNTLFEWISGFQLYEEIPMLREVLHLAWLPAAESTSAIFSIFTATFPLSALCAVGYLFNSQGLFAETRRAIVRRFPRVGWAMVILLIACAIAAAVRPVVFLMLPEATPLIGFQSIIAINLAAFVFEFLLGVFFLTYLMLMAYAWMRGLHFHRYRLLQLAARRTGFVLRWSMVLAALALVFVFSPQFLALLIDQSMEAAAAALWTISEWGIVGVILVTLIFAPLSTVLVFHNDSLRKAMRETVTFVRGNLALLLPFFLAVYLPFLLVASVRVVATQRLGAGTIADAGVTLLCVIAKALLAGWLIASWVCLYKSRFSSRKEIEF